MAQLTCGAQACSYNQNNCCCKGDIMVGASMPNAAENTCCESFHKRDGSSLSARFHIQAPTISIDCEAVKCIYNADYRCKAEKVAIKETVQTAAWRQSVLLLKRNKAEK